MKYIILEDFDSPIIFPDILSHNDMAAGRPVKSAGFCSLQHGDEYFADCWGKSVSLGAASHEKDGDILTKFLFTR